MFKKPETLLRITATLSVAVSTILVVIKVITYFYTGSVAILASLVDSVLDLTISCINYLAVIYALKPQDDDHRFGHTAIEDIAGLAQAVFIFGSGLFVLMQAIKSLIEKSVPMHDDLGISAMVISLLLTTLLVLFQKYTLRKTNSLVIKADSLHYQSDILLALATLASFTIIKYTGLGYIDGLAAICIAVYMFITSVKLGKAAFDNLMCKELPENVKSIVTNIIKSFPEVKGFHDLKTRGAGRMKFIQFHIELDKTLNLQEAHNISDDIEHKIMKQIENSEVLIHKDPR